MVIWIRYSEETIIAGRWMFQRLNRDAWCASCSLMCRWLALTFTSHHRFLSHSWWRLKNRRKLLNKHFKEIGWDMCQWRSQQQMWWSKRSLVDSFLLWPNPRTIPSPKQTSEKSCKFSWNERKTSSLINFDSVSDKKELEKHYKHHDDSFKKQQILKHREWSESENVHGLDNKINKQIKHSR